MFSTKEFHKPIKFILNLIDEKVSISALVTSLVLCLITYCGFIYFAINLSINDYQQFDAVKIMYVHVPSAWISILGFVGIFVCSIGFFVYKTPILTILSMSFAKIGCVFCGTSIITGAIWGKAIWGTWWVWDARLTSMLLLFILYCSYIVSYNALFGRSAGEKILAIIGILGFLDIPIIKFSVEYFNTLHQTSSFGQGETSMHSSFYRPLFVSFLINLWLYVTLVLCVAKAEILKAKYLRKALRV